MKIITFDNIKNIGITPLQCYEWVSEAIQNKHDVILPAKISLKPEVDGVFYNTMPAILPFAAVGGVKHVTRYPNRKPSLNSQILLYDLSTGENIALLDGNWITAMRTGAVAVHTIHMLAISDFAVVGFIGLGNTARATMKTLLAVYPNRQLKIKLKKYKNQHELFAKRFSGYSNIQFEAVDTYEELIDGSDVVISAATVFDEDICPDKYFKEGVLVVPIHTRGFMNCDLFFNRVFADDVNHVKKFRYFDRFNSFAEVADVVSGLKPGRENDKERIIAYNIGIALHDIFFAKKIYDMIKDECLDVSLNAPKEKFWV